MGIGLNLLAIIIFGIQDAISKLLVQDYSPFQLAMVRFWAFAAFSLFLVSRQAPLRQAFRSRQPVLQWLRVVLLVGLVLALTEPRLRLASGGLDLWVLADRSDSAAAAMGPNFLAVSMST